MQNGANLLIDLVFFVQILGVSITLIMYMQTLILDLITALWLYTLFAILQHFPLRCEVHPEAAIPACTTRV